MVVGRFIVSTVRSAFRHFTVSAAQRYGGESLLIHVSGIVLEFGFHCAADVSVRQFVSDLRSLSLS